MKRTILFTATAAALLIPGSLAWGSSYRGENTIRSLARDVERASRELYRSAERYAHHEDYRESKALDQLHELHRSAEHFRHELQRSRRWRGHLGSDYDRLRKAYRQAHYSRNDLRGLRQVDRDFYRLSQSMRYLEEAVGGWYRHYGYRPYRSYRPGIHITLGYGNHGHYGRYRGRDYYYRDRHDRRRYYDSRHNSRRHYSDKRYYKGRKHKGSNRGNGHYDNKDRHDDDRRDHDRSRRGSASRTRPRR